MRHINRVQIGLWNPNHGKPRLEPYLQLNFRPFKTRSNKWRNWVRILQFIANNPGCKRRDVLIGIGAINAFTDKWRGQHSCVFANLLYRDLIDYDKEFTYDITDAGLNMLRRLGFVQKWM